MELWHKSLAPSKEGQTQLWGSVTYASCETTSNIGELQQLRSINNGIASLFRWTMADYICSSYFVISLQIENIFTKYMFTKQLQGLLLHTSAYNFARRYLPIKKLPINIFTQFWKFSKFNPVKKKKKDWCCSGFIYYCKGKIWSNRKIVKLEIFFWFLMSLIPLAVAYIISVMWTGFLMANMCPHNTLGLQLTKWILFRCCCIEFE